MQLNRNKLIFFIIWWILVLIILIFIFIWTLSPKDKTWESDSRDKLLIWTVFPELKDTQSIISKFKELYPKYKTKSIVVENFSDYETYTYALESAFSSSKWPDIFVLNNNETSVFSDRVLWISPSNISVNDFRKNYKPIFTDELIIKTQDNQEFLVWVPVWYETLWVFYNKRYVRSSDLKTISSMNLAISKLKRINRSSIPLWIWNWTTVKYSSDIITQFMLLEEWWNSIDSLSSSQIKTAFWAYLNYWYKDSDNNYNSSYQNLKDNDKNSSYLFANNNSFMVIWYPRFINDIIKYSWISKTFLFVEPFPHYVPWKWKTLINYDYFVLNKDSKNILIWQDFLTFLASNIWQETFLNSYPFYLPANLSLESELDTRKINDSYNIVIWNFYDDSYELTSFDKWIKNIYDNKLPIILDLWENYFNSFSNFSRKLNCMTKKVLNFTNISNSCE